MHPCLVAADDSLVMPPGQSLDAKALTPLHRKPNAKVQQKY